MKKFLLTYIPYTIGFALISCGVVISAARDSVDTAGYAFFLLLIPMTILFLILTWVNIRWAMPHLLLKNRLMSYCGLMLALSFIATYAAIFCEAIFRQHIGVPQRIHNFLSPWIAVDNLCNCILLFLMMVGLGFFKVYQQWQNELHSENRLSDSLSRYIDIVRHRLNPDMIVARLDSIISHMSTDPAAANNDIASFCRRLRSQLYELPAPEVVDNYTPSPSSSPAFRLLSAKKMRGWRFLIFQSILISISFSVFFNAPDSPEFTADRAGSFAAMYLFLNAVSYLVILVLYPRFRKTGSLRRYVGGVIGLAAAVILPMILIQILTYDLSPYSSATPMPLMVLSALSSTITIALFIGGVSAILFLQNWLHSQCRSTLLHAEYVRQEYAFLRKQINPHFLFNVLNNAGILSDEDPQESVEMLRELRRLLIYQFQGTNQTETSLSDEINFLRSYLSLQATRIEPFSYSINVQGDADSICVPTLIFITFVENAVKHSTVIDGHRDVDVDFHISRSGVKFTCRNTYRPHLSLNNGAGGVGLANTRRRLELLYGDNLSLSTTIVADHYLTNLFMPYDKLYYC